MTRRGKLIWDFPEISPPSCHYQNKAIDFGGGGGLHGCPPTMANRFMSQSPTSTPLSGTPLDELTEGAANQQFIEKHQVKLIALASLLIISALVYLVLREMKQSKEETAGALLVSASEASDLENITGNFADTAAAGSAKLLLADKQWEDGKQDDAIATLRSLIDSKEAHPARANAQASLASKLLLQGKVPDAEAIYTDITEDSAAGYLAAYAWLALGDIAVKKGDLEAAGKAYGIVEKDFSGTYYSQDATKRRLLMNAQKPVEIAAPVQPLDPKITNGEGLPTGDVQIQNMLDGLKANSQGTLPPGLLEGNDEKK